MICKFDPLAFHGMQKNFECYSERKWKYDDCTLGGLWAELDKP